MSKELHIIYMGTPEFAVEPLRAILGTGYHVIAVITAPDKPAGRGQKLHMSPVKEFALQQNLKVLQPINLKDAAFISELQSLGANLMVVVAFRMLPETVWRMPEFGTLNLHASLLPQYRGAAPINHAIINGETETGLTTFFLEKEIDTGNIIYSQKLPVLPSDDAGSLHDKLMIAGGEVMLKTLKMISEGNVVPVKQEKLVGDASVLFQAPKIFKKDCLINWNNTCTQIHNFVRGLSPYPGAFTNLYAENEGIRQVKIFKTSFENSVSGSVPGTILADDKNPIAVACADGIIHIEVLQMEGKKRMMAAEFARGIQDLNQMRFGV